MSKKKTTEEFIAEARKVHGDKYDYSKVEYVNSSTKVCIICPEHGEFWQIPNGHLSGKGCLNCSIINVHNKQRLTSEEFIAKAKEIHGDKYDYSKVEYVDSKTKVCIICPEHGEFWQTPVSHLSGNGCSKCSGRYRISQEEFIDKAKQIHGNKYDYSTVEYIDKNTKVCIICPEHGEFWQTPSSHLRGQGCPGCSGKIKRTTEEFITEARKVHGDKYDYTKVKYISANKKVCIICPEHGEFLQTPYRHLFKKCGCPGCSGKIKRTTEEFITEARKVHGNRYDYSKVKYINNNIKVCIICPEHGEFWQTPSSHLNGKGCSKCSGNAKRTTEEFITEARKVHGDKYDYTKVKYISANKKVCIICPEHDEFWQTPASHLNGSKCPSCSYKHIDKEEFIVKAKTVHDDIYDYSKVEYVNKTTKVCIICPEHGEFWQTPVNHLNGSKCPKCSGNVKMTTEEFITKAKEIHGDKYDYSKVEYVDSKTKVCIICPEHGEFWQVPSSHLFKKCGCPKCSGNVKMTTEEFITKAKEVHGDKYDYSKVEYINSSTKVCIICPEHGVFWQVPSAHLSGQGCPYCGANTNFFKGDKLRLIEEIDLLSMSSFALMALIGINKLPEEFKSIARFARNSQDRQNAINKLKELYGSDSDDIQDIQDIDINNTEIQSEEYSCDTFDNTDDFNQDDNSLNVFNEIESVDKVLAKDSVDDIVNFGDNEEFILRTEVNGLLNCLLRDMEKARLNKSTNLPTIIRIKAEFSTATPWKKYVYTEFLRIYNNVKNMKVS